MFLTTFQTPLAENNPGDEVLGSLVNLSHPMPGEGVFVGFVTSSILNVLTKRFPINTQWVSLLLNMI